MYRVIDYPAAILTIPVSRTRRPANCVALGGVQEELRPRSSNSAAAAEPGFGRASSGGAKENAETELTRLAAKGREKEDKETTPTGWPSESARAFRSLRGVNDSTSVSGRRLSNHTRRRRRRFVWRALAAGGVLRAPCAFIARPTGDGRHFLGRHFASVHVMATMIRIRRARNNSGQSNIQNGGGSVIEPCRESPKKNAGAIEVL